MFVAEVGDSFGFSAVCMAEISTLGMAPAEWVPVMLPPPMRPMCVVICSEPNRKLKRGCTAVTLSLKKKVS